MPRSPVRLPISSAPPPPTSCSRSGRGLALQVRPGAFRPPPLVESAVLHLRSRGAVPVGDEARFRRVVLAAFGQRRKAVANALAAGLQVSASTARERLRLAGIDATRRA